MSSFIAFGGSSEKKYMLGRLAEKIKDLEDEWAAVVKSKSAQQKKEFFDAHSAECTVTEYFIWLFQIDHSVRTALTNFFDTWRRLLEGAAKLAIRGHDMEMPQFENHDSSSPILYFLMKDRDSHEEYRELFQDIEYDYKGFCPHALLERLGALLEFPIGTLFEKVPSLSLPAVYADIYDKLSEIEIPTELPALIDGPRKNAADIMKLLEKNKSRLLEMEKYYDDWAKALDSINYIIEHNILNTFL